MVTDDEGKDLFDLLPDALANHPHYCTSANYDNWEREVAEPALKGLGYKVNRWWTGDGDSFGPLVRCVSLTRDGVTENYSYG